MYGTGNWQRRLVHRAVGLRRARLALYFRVRCGRGARGEWCVGEANIQAGLGLFPQKSARGGGPGTKGLMILLLTGFLRECVLHKQFQATFTILSLRPELQAVLHANLFWGP